MRRRKRVYAAGTLTTLLYAGLFVMFPLAAGWCVQALVDAGVLVRGLRGQGAEARDLWLRSVVERARARGDAAVLAAALRTREEAEAAALAERLAARP